MPNKELNTALLVLTVAVILGCSREPPPVSFATEVMPILNDYCAECHLSEGAGSVASGFRIDSYELVMNGTKFGPVIVQGDALSSSLYRLVSGKVHSSIQMPHGKESLQPGEIVVIENWIEQGANDN